MYEILTAIELYVKCTLDNRTTTICKRIKECFDAKNRSMGIICVCKLAAIENGEKV